MSAKRFSGKVAIVTGSSGGLGYAIAQRLGEEGATILISSSKQENVDDAVKKLKEHGIDASGTVCDVSKRDDTINLVKTCITRYGRLDILVPNAALSYYFGSLLKIPEADYDKYMNANLKSGFWLAREAESYLEKTRGTIIFIGSTIAHNPQANFGMYSITKTALLAMVKVLALELSNKCIRVNAVNPGIFNTDMATRACERLANGINETGGQQIVTADDIKQKLIENIPIKRFGKPPEIGGVVAFLASDDASYITGESMIAGGGLSRRL